MTRSALHRSSLSLWSLLVAMAGFLSLADIALAADKPNGAQRRAVEQYLDAVASGSPQAVAYAIHPADLESLRTKVLTKLREEAGRGENTLRSRLFGPGRSLAELERMTPIDFYATLGRKLYLFGREYKDADWLAAIPDDNGVVQVVLRGKPAKERGTVNVLDNKVSVVNVVSIRPYGKDWKATLPSEIEAQIDDLANARRSIYAGLPPPAAASGPARPGSAPAEVGLPPAITELLDAAAQALAVPSCEDYYRKYMSPNFRKVTSKKALEALINTCMNSLATREMLVATVRIVKDMVPKFEYEGRRAVYDLSGQGLPYDRFVLEQVDRKWYIAE
jgi:hypothetical protein